MRPARDGFILIEVVVAFLILATALAVGVRAIAQGGLAIRRAQEIAAASAVAGEVAATTLGGLAEGERAGTHPNGAVWRVRARALPDGADPPVLAVAIEVRPAGAARPYRFRSFAIGVGE